MGDFQTVALWGVSVACTVLGWFARELWSAVNKLKQDLQSLALEINEKYIRKDDFASIILLIFNIESNIFSFIPYGFNILAPSSILLSLINFFNFLK